MPSAALSTDPICPTRTRPTSSRLQPVTMQTPTADRTSLPHSSLLPPNANVGTFSLGPATKTTVVTTTTTTTTSFPPLIMKPPRQLLDRDPSMYPLAASPTPRSLRRFSFDVGGRLARFEEAENASQKLHQFAQEQDVLRANHGSTISSETRNARNSRPSPLGSKSRRTPSLSSTRRPLSVHDADAIEMDSFLRRHRPHQKLSPSRRREHISETSTDDEDAAPRSPSSPPSTTRLPAHVPAHASDASTLSRTDSTESAFGGPSLLPTMIHEARATSNDASLPSPSLSPITAAATLTRGLSNSLHDSRSSALTSAQPVQCTSPAEDDEPVPDTGAVARIPELLDSFDDMPDEMKTYVMYQLLRRCPKQTLHLVAEVVDPAMRCDFIGRLPLELSWNVLQYLDAKSLCRAAQVSRKWRLIVDTDEKTWKNLTDAEDFEITPAELQKAAEEGWGWQITGSADELSEIARVNAVHMKASDPDCAASVPRSSAVTTADTFTRSLKRKKTARALYLPSEKRQKRRSDPDGLTDSLSALAKKQGPNAVAVAAAARVPRGVGIPRLQNLHFFKSLYQRHANMRQAWLAPDSRPKHFAFRAHDRRVVTCLQFDKDKIITGSDDCNIDIFETRTGKSLKRLQGHEGGVWALEYHGDLLVSGSTDRTVRIWDLKRGRLLHVFQGHTSTVRCLQILQPVQVGQRADGSAIMKPEQPLIITGSRDSFCRVWTLPLLGDAPQLDDPHRADENPYFKHALRGHSNSVRAIAAHGDTLVSGSYDTSVRVWRISSGECLATLRGHTSKVYSVVLDHERNRCISGSMDYMVKVWSLDGHNCMFNLSGHSSLVGLLDLSNDLLVSAAADASLRVWDPATGECKHELTGHTGAITCFLHDKRKIISGSDKTLKLWDIKTGECVRDLLTDLGSVWQIKFDERRCVAAVQRQDQTYIEVIDFDQCSHPGDADFQNGPDSGRRIVVDSRGRPLPDDLYEHLRAGEDAADETGDVNAIDPLP